MVEKGTQMKIKKGDAGYICRRKRNCIIKTIVEFGIVIALEWQRWRLQTVADIDDSCIGKPFHCTNIFPIARTASNLGNLEAFVFSSQESSYMSIYRQDFGFVKP